MRIVFHGTNAEIFGRGIEAFLTDATAHEITFVPDVVETPIDRETFEKAEVLVGVALKESHPVAPTVKLYQAPAAGIDQIDASRLPKGASLCNAFGHEAAIAEYVMAALLARHVPIAASDKALRSGDWSLSAGRADGLHTEIGDLTLGILGFGHIGKAVAKAAKGFGMSVHVCNRSAVETGPLVDRAFGLDELSAFTASVDVVLSTLPLTDSTKGMVGREAIRAMKPGAVLMNVGRGPVIDEEALYDALASERIEAIIDTWYQYPTTDEPKRQPSELPFQELRGLTMTPHMSAWTHGTIRRRQQLIAENIRRLTNGEPLLNLVLTV